MTKKMALGRGLGALIEDAEPAQLRRERAEREDVPVTKMIEEIEVNLIEANPYQPRTTFDQELLEELSDSIKSLGIVQPLTVRALNGKFQLISGERRLRAARMAGLTTVPAYVRTANDQGMLEMALVENIQRQDLNAIEVAISFQRLIDECSLTHESLSERVAKKRATISNYLRLLKLPAEIQLAIKEGKISMGHARAMITIDDPLAQIKIYRQILAKDLSVRATEEMVRNLSNPKEPKPDTQPDPKQVIAGENVAPYQNKLKQWFGWGAELKTNPKGNGKIIITYRNQNELDEIIEKLNNLGE